MYLDRTPIGDAYWFHQFKPGHRTCITPHSLPPRQHGATGTRSAHTQLKSRRRGNPPAPEITPRHSSTGALGRNRHKAEQSLRCSKTERKHTHAHRKPNLSLTAVACAPWPVVARVEYIIALALGTRTIRLPCVYTLPSTAVPACHLPLARPHASPRSRTNLTAQIVRRCDHCAGTERCCCPAFLSQNFTRLGPPFQPYTCAHTRLCVSSLQTCKQSLLSKSEIDILDAYREPFSAVLMPYHVTLHVLMHMQNFVYHA